MSRCHNAECRRLLTRARLPVRAESILALPILALSTGQRLLQAGRQRCGLALACAGLSLVVACVEPQDHPSTPQMCEELVEECGDPRLAPYLPGYCALFGQAGLEDARDEDQCFAVYDDCIDECRYFNFLLKAGALGQDASTPSQDSGSDAGGADSAAVTDSAAATDSAADAGG